MSGNDYSFGLNLLRYEREREERERLLREAFKSGVISLNPDVPASGYDWGQWCELVAREYRNVADWYGLPSLP